MLKFETSSINIVHVMVGTSLKVPCHAFPVITRPLVCYVACYACKRSAESQTLIVHPVGSKTLTQKRPVYADPECLVGDFSFSIVYFLGIVTYFGYSDVT